MKRDLERLGEEQKKELETVDRECGERKLWIKRKKKR